LGDGANCADAADDNASTLAIVAIESRIPEGAIIDITGLENDSNDSNIQGISQPNPKGNRSQLALLCKLQGTTRGCANREGSGAAVPGAPRPRRNRPFLSSVRFNAYRHPLPHAMRAPIIMSAWRQNDGIDPQRTFLRPIVALWRGKIPLCARDISMKGVRRSAAHSRAMQDTPMPQAFLETVTRARADDAGDVLSRARRLERLKTSHAKRIAKAPSISRSANDFDRSFGPREKSSASFFSPHHFSHLTSVSSRVMTFWRSEAFY
jgi:hypothetical protein